jgi:hypothetical protein
MKCVYSDDEGACSAVNKKTHVYPEGCNDDGMCVLDSEDYPEGDCSFCEMEDEGDIDDLSDVEIDNNYSPDDGDEWEEEDENCA